MKITKLKIIKICNKIKLDFEDYNLLGFGAHNINYLINTKQGKFVLRIENNLQYNNLEKEYNYLKKTNGKLGPKVFLFDDSKKIIPKNYFIEEFIIGNNINNKISNINLKKFGLWFKKLHKDKSPNHIFSNNSNTFDLNLFFNIKYYNSYKKYNNILDINLKLKLKKLNSIFIDVINLNKKSFSKIKYLSLNHSDPSPSNCFIEKNGNIRLIDWEFIKYDLPEFDLIFFIWSNELSLIQKKIFLDAYGYSNTFYANNKYKIIEIIMYFSFLTWLFERLNLSLEDKLKAKVGVYCSSRKEINEKIKSHLIKIENLINTIVK